MDFTNYLEKYKKYMKKISNVKIGGAGQITGPMNIAHLRGLIDGVEKNIYLFFDIHNVDTKCDDPAAKKINDYFKELFETTTKQLDFFLEISEYDIKNKIASSKTSGIIYINEVRILAEDGISYVENKINSKYANVRIHFNEIRTEKFFIETKFHYFEKIFELIYQVDNETDDKKIDFVGLHMTTFISTLAHTVKYISDVITLSGSDDHDIFYYFRKTIEKYNHEFIKNIIYDIYADDVYTILNNLIDEYNKIIARYAKGYGVFNMLDYYSMYSTVQKTYAALLNLIIYINDLYTLRRILDKDYVTNAIVYEGASHCINMLRILINNFGFDLVGIEKNNLSSKEELVKEVNKIPNYVTWDDDKGIAENNFNNLNKYIKIDAVTKMPFTQCISRTDLLP